MSEIDPPQWRVGMNGGAGYRGAKRSPLGRGQSRGEHHFKDRSALQRGPPGCNLAPVLACM